VSSRPRHGGDAHAAADDRTDYAGDSWAKRFTQARLHATCARFIRAFLALSCRYVNELPPRRPPGSAFVLAGNEGAEAGPLLELQGWSTVLVDRSANGVARGLARYPVAFGYVGEMADALHRFTSDDQAERPRWIPDAGMFKPLRFLHMDLCGHVDSTTREAIGAARGLIVPGSIVAVTYLRGREGMTADINSPYVRRHARGTRGGRTLDARRLFLCVDALVGPLSPWKSADFVPVFYAQYRGHSVPMQTIAFQLAPNALRPRRHRDLRPEFLIEGAPLRFTEHLCKRDISLWRREGASVASLAAIYNLPESSVRAIVAHGSRGSYGAL
jgi:hypothetical protein